MNSAFFREIILRRQARLNETRENGIKPTPAKRRGISTCSFDTILEEEPDSMNLKAYTTTTRAQRRRALSNIPRELRTALEDISEEVSPHKSLNLPLPPLPTSSSLSRSLCKSPPLLSSSLPSSPDSHKAALPLTPSSSVDELPLPSRALQPKRLATIKPLVINKSRRAVERSGESDSEDSDSEWYTREFSSLLSVQSSSQPMPLPAAHRDSIFVAPSDSPFSPLSASFPVRQQRKFTGVNVLPPPVPPIPPKFRSTKCNKTLSITAPRRPPPRMSIPDDACSAFSLSIYTDDIVDAERSPLSMYSPESAPMTVRKDLDEGVEFPGDFDMQVDYPMMLPFSLPGSPIDPEVDIMNGLEDLSLQKESVPPVSPIMKGLGVGFLLEESDYDGRASLCPNVSTPRISFTSPPPSPTVLRSPPPPPPSPMPPAVPPPRPRRCSTISNLSSISFPPSPCIPRHELPPECITQDDDFDERKLGLKSKWSSSSISSLHEGHLPSTPKFPSASKLKMYFQGQHKRGTNNSSLSSIVSPKPSRSSSSPAKTKRKSKKETRKDRGGSDIPEREVLVIGYNNNLPSPKPSFHYSPFSSTTSPRSSYDRTLISPNSSPRHSPDMFDLPPTLPVPSRSSRYHGHIRSSSQGSAISDSGSDSSSVSVASHSSHSNGTGLRRKPIPLDIFSRNGV